MFAIDGDLKAILEIPGARSVSLIDSDRVVAEFGHDAAFCQEESGGAMGVVRAIVENPKFVSSDISGLLEEMVLTTRHEHLIVAVVGVPGRSRWRIQFQMDRRNGDLALGQWALRRLAARLAAVANGDSPPYSEGLFPARHRASDGGSGASAAGCGSRERPLPRRTSNLDRLPYGSGEQWSPPDRATLERVLASLRSLCTSSPAGPGTQTRTEAT